MRKSSPPDYKFLGNCPICNRKFTATGAQKLDEMGAMQTLYIECRECGSSVILGVVRDVPGVVTTVGMLTDMNREDIDRLEKLTPITHDDVLEVHKYFETRDPPAPRIRRAGK